MIRTPTQGLLEPYLDPREPYLYRAPCFDFPVIRPLKKGWLFGAESSLVSLTLISEVPAAPWLTSPNVTAEDCQASSFRVQGLGLRIYMPKRVHVPL